MVVPVENIQESINIKEQSIIFVRSYSVGGFRLDGIKPAFWRIVMVNGFISCWINCVNRWRGAQVLRVSFFAWVLGVLVGGGGAVVVAGPPDKVVEVGAGSPIEIQIDPYGIEWCVVGDVNNPPFPGHKDTGDFEGEGSIPYVYRMTRTEIKVREYLDFVIAYAPFYDGNPRSSDLTGAYIFGSGSGDDYKAEIPPGMEELGTTMSMRMAARFCNWMHNGRVNEKWAFETGVYDTSTFTRNEDGSFNDDYTKSPDARYWIPSVGEWLKGVYYDPNRFGNGAGGWWRQPNGSDKPARIGLPLSAGVAAWAGETNASLGRTFFNDFHWWSSGLYPEKHSPWGLLDTSGGASEMTDVWEFGSEVLEDAFFVPYEDEAGTYGAWLPVVPWVSIAWGVRLASRVPVQKINSR